MKKLAKTMILLALVLMMTAEAQPAYAFSRDMALYAMRQREETGIENAADPITWMQGRVPYAMDRYLKAGTSGDRVGNGGCSYFAASYMLLKMGQLDVYNGETPMTVLDKMESVKGWLTWGKMDYTRINEVYPDVTCAAYKKKFQSADFHKQVEELRELTEKGYFIILCLDGNYTNGHYIFVDEILDDDDMVIGDSAYEGTNWSDTHKGMGGYLVDYSIFKCKNVKPSDTDSIYTYNVQEKLSPEYIEEMEAKAKARRTSQNIGKIKNESKTGSSAGSTGSSTVGSSVGSAGSKPADESESKIELPGGKTLVVQ